MAVLGISLRLPEEDTPMHLLQAVKHLFTPARPAHLRGIQPIHKPVNQLWQQVCSEHNLQQAFDWLCEGSDDTHPNSDLWDYRRNWAETRLQLKRRLQTGSFRFQTVSIIETAEGKRREIRSAEDRLVTRAISQVLQPVLQPRLSAHCTHIQGNGGLHQAVRDTQEYIQAHPGHQVIKSDVKGYYAHIDHSILLDQLHALLPNEIELNRQLYHYLHRTTEFGGEYRDVEKGIPLGSSLSPLLAAIYLSPLDQLARETRNSFYRRYMDDWVWVMPKRHSLRKAVKDQVAALQALRVEMHPDKTFIGKVAKGFDFLGFHCCPTGMTVSDATLSRRDEKIARLYEQGASKRRVGLYLARWFGWVLGVVAHAAFAGACPDVGDDNDAGTFPSNYANHQLGATSCRTQTFVEGGYELYRNIKSSVAFYVFLLIAPDSNPRPGGTYPTLLRFTNGSGSLTPTVTCPGATVTISAIDVAEIALGDGESCTLTASVINGYGGLPYYYSGTLSRSGDVYSTSGGVYDQGCPPGTYCIAIANTTDGAENNGGSPVDAVFTVTVTPTNNSGSAITGNVTYTGSATNGTDYATGATSFSIPDGQSTTTINLTVSEDTLVEGTETVTATLSSPSAGSLGTPAASANLSDDDSYSIAIANTTEGAENNGGTPTDAVFTVTVTPTNNSGSAITGNVTYTGSATNGTDYATGATSFSIPDGQSTAIITLDVSEDTLEEGTETITATLSSPSTGALGTATASANITDDDDDGVTAAVEDAGPNGGDANGDNIPDSLQATVASLPSAAGTGYIAASVSGCTIEQVQATVPAVPDPAYYASPFGHLGFRIPCASATVTIYYHGTASLADHVYRKYGPAPGGGTSSWYELPGVTFGQATVGGQTVATATLNLQDGQLGDSTGVDGAIVDPGGPARAPAPVQPVPGMGPLALLFLSGLLGLVGLGVKRRLG
jgi:RNA-directed DNA polymerase